MDASRLEGLIDAIETESKTPSPSHANLARLIVLFFKELLIIAKEEPKIESLSEVKKTKRKSK